MSDLPLLLPRPREMTLAGGTWSLPEKRLIVLEGGEAQALLHAARRLQDALRGLDLSWEIVAGNAVPGAQAGITLNVVPQGTRHPQGYELTVTPAGVYIVASEPAGAFYGSLTLIQLIDQVGRDLPLCRISDWPDFAVRGVMLDVARDRVPQMQELFALVDMLVSWKVNQFQLYMEHTFAYRNHPEVWAEASPFTGEEILALDAYCRERFVELTPNQNSFGHMHRWLKFERYQALAETHDWFDTGWGTLRMKGPFSITPVDPGSLDLLRSMYDELLPHFSSRQFNVGCDETIDLGQGRSKDACASRGKGRVYLDFLMQIYREVKARGHTMQFWGDIIVKYPELVPELPRDTVALEWGYEAEHPFDANGATFAASGVPFYVCPGTSSWNTLVGRTDNTIGNLRNAAENGLKHGAVGFLNTDWGDRGHWQQPWASYLGFAYGAAVSWAYEANRDIDIGRATSVYAFRDRTGNAGRVAYDLGNVYKAAGATPHNSSVLFWILQMTPDELKGSARLADLPAITLDQASAAIDAAMAPLDGARIERPDADLLHREMQHAAALLRHATRRGQLVFDGGGDADALKRELAAEARALVAEQRALWLARSRPGGLEDSLARLAFAQEVL
ncbi:MAG: Beta-hexosaminidase [Chloroflexi bacterium ADurb.Bin325]|nr:MAG: Beta-hexosaminidase [Chloroflexi bacterium ADurb.Bin325]